MRPITRATRALLLAVVAACGEGPTRPTTHSPPAPALADHPYPDLIRLPDDFAPEGIAVGSGSTFYVGSILPPTLGQILVGDLRTGSYAELVGPTGSMALGIKHDARSNLLFVAGGPSGRATVYDAGSGAVVRTYQLGPPPALVNDVIVTPDAAYFTDSERPFLYRVALGPNGQPGAASAIALPTNFALPGACRDGPPHNSNGIAATANGKHLILVHMSEGKLYRIDPTLAEVREIDLGGADVCSTDGLLLDGGTLYAVQNTLNRVAVVSMASDLLSGRVSAYLTEPFASNPATRVPTTLAKFNGALYAVTAGFALPSPDYVVRVWD